MAPLTTVSPTVVLVDTVSLLYQCLESLNSVNVVAIDLEGVNLGRSGTLSLIQLYHAGDNTAWIVDVTVLGANQALDYTGGLNDVKLNSLRAILEDRQVRKLYFDCRADTDCFYHQHSIRQEGVYDVQLLSHLVAPGTYLLSMSNAMIKFLNYGTYDVQLKKAGGSSFRFEQFEERPLVAELLKYAAQDVVVVWKIYNAIKGRAPPSAERRVLQESKVRLDLVARKLWSRQNRDNARAPRF